MSIRRPVGLVSLMSLLLLAVAAGWLLLQSRLAAVGVSQLEATGLMLTWNRVGFERLVLVYSGEGEPVRVELGEPMLTVDWGGWQLASLEADTAKVVGTDDPLPQTSGPATPAHGFRLQLPQSFPFWLPRRLDLRSLEAAFPCQGGRCRLQGNVGFERGGDGARLQVDAVLHREDRTLALVGDVRLGSGSRPSQAAGGELRLEGIRPWLPPTLTAQAGALMPDSATLRFAPGRLPAGPEQWPLQVTLESDGGAGLAFEGQLLVDTAGPWQLDIMEGRVVGALSRWQVSGWVLDGIAADLPVTGQVSSDHAALSLEQGATLSVDHADPLATDTLTWLDGVSLVAEGASFQWDQGRWRFQGPLLLSAEQLRYPGLVPQPWHYQARARWQQGLDLTGTLSNQAGTEMPLALTYDPTQGVMAEASMALTPDNQANQLAATLEPWPGSLTLDQGRVELTADLQWPPAAPLTASADLRFLDAAGLYQQSAWEGLSGRVLADWQPQGLSVTLKGLDLDTLNPGVPIGPVRLQGQYQAATAAPAAGQVTLAQASAGFAGGTVRLEPGSWSLAERSWLLPVEVRNLALSQLMELYPTEGLSGDGILEGELPVTVGPGGIRIDNGRLHALAPGGHLALPAERLRAMASTNATMAMVARAMEDFEYRQLQSRIDYAEDGALLLDLRLEGSSPKLDTDRPVVLNISLEENIPALLTSLQLSGRVNEAVTRRVRERLGQQEAGTP